MDDNDFLITNIRVYTETGFSDLGYISVKGSKIQSIGNGIYHQQETDNAVLDGNGLMAIPGFIDGHIHGAAGADVMDATPDALDIIASALPAEGTTSFLATTITQSIENIEKALENTARYKTKHGSAELIGVHLEGPFIAESKAGAQPKKYIIQPNIELFKKLQHLSEYKIKTVTLAPEKDHDGSFIEFLVGQDINVSAGHTDAGIKEMKRAVSLGVNQLTHICNAMTGIHHRDIGVVGSAFLLNNLRCELIADGIHVSPEMLELIFKNIGSKRLMLITDALRAKCLQPGKYDLGGQVVTVDHQQAVLPDGTLAGSILKMVNAGKNMLKYTDASLEDIVEMASVNPAKQLNLYDRKGSLASGKDADILLIDDDFNIKYTICRGKIAFRGG